MTEREGLFSVPTRLLLSAEHRLKLEALVHAREADLADVLSEIVAEYLDAQGEIEPIEPPGHDKTAELQRRRAELARLRARRNAGSTAPAWLVSYISALEAEIERLAGTG